MRIAYAGTATYGALVLERLLAHGRPETVAVVTRPDRPRGRHGTPQPSPVKEVAVAARLPVCQPDRLAGEALAGLVALGPEALVVCAHGEILDASVADHLTTIVVHPSLLPAWRGPAPVERALMAGETALGVTVVRLAEAVDAGPIAGQTRVTVPRTADAGEAFRRLADPAARLVAEAVSALTQGSLRWRPQEGQATYAPKLTKKDREIDWRRPAQRIVDQVRALSPRIGARTTLRGRPLIVWRARVATDAVADGDSPLVVAAADRAVEILELQAPGGRRQAADSFLRGAGRWLVEG